MIAAPFNKALVTHPLNHLRDTMLARVVMRSKRMP